MITLSFEDTIAHLKFCRTEKGNSMNREFFNSLKEKLEEIKSNIPTRARALILSGEGKHFSTGADLDFLKSLLEETVAIDSHLRESHLFKQIREMQEIFSLLDSLEIPTIAAIHGLCLGGAVDLIAACDIRLSTKFAHFSILETKLGIPADLGSLQRLHSLLGGTHLKHLAFTSELFSAGHALKIGLVLKTYFTKRQLLSGARKLALSIAQNPYYSVCETKKSINSFHHQKIEEDLLSLAKINSKGLLSLNFKPLAKTSR